MGFTPGVPLKVIIAVANVGFIALAVLKADEPLFTMLAAVVWGIHGLMALVTLLGLAARKGQGSLWALQVLMVGTASFLHLRQLPDTSESS